MPMDVYFVRRKVHDVTSNVPGIVVFFDLCLHQVNKRVAVVFIGYHSTTEGFFWQLLSIRSMLFRECFRFWPGKVSILGQKTKSARSGNYTEVTSGADPAENKCQYAGTSHWYGKTARSVSPCVPGPSQISDDTTFVVKQI